MPLTIPGYKYCGPFTENMNVRPKNDLDQKCREHDLAYLKSNDLRWRCNADRKLKVEAYKIYRDRRKCSERTVAFIVYNIMKIKMAIMCRHLTN